MDFLLEYLLLTEVRDPDIARILRDSSTSTIHPVFQQRRWDGLSDDGFIFCRPALVLASYLLTCPRGLHFFHAFLFGEHTIHRDRHGMTRTRFDPVYDTQRPLPPEEEKRVLAALEEISNLIRVRFADTGRDDGRCQPGDTVWTDRFQCITSPLATRSTISISQRTLDRIQGQHLSGPAPLRCWFSLAVTLVHEFGHAIWYAAAEPETEGIFANQDFCEMGYAVTSWIVHGRPEISQLRHNGEEVLALRHIPNLSMVEIYRESGLFPLFRDLGPDNEMIGIVDDAWLKELFMGITSNKKFVADNGEGLRPTVTYCQCEDCRVITDTGSYPTHSIDSVDSADYATRPGCVAHAITRPDLDGGAASENIQWMLSLSQEGVEALRDPVFRTCVLALREKYPFHNRD
ncbi:hypothetical protein CLAFUW4_00203 [Fulvia fulva]|uniref:Uncharacterized protein n=1 Tax=Passalora fulva TaxID=5499 RepID=A0A9Q8L8Q3_PASFU|nr:uncharacterized protein CLAFUR5_00203 [Fulvia fulva]KAK4635958.1 hypothetical protein CLAFUR4_00203 [Fulvia fulva]KAK4636939.1 hypothetical protein CLAFUR0_00204 [Fulvia fulva]UJO12918.1 hypothetical protein CLAFUR5_00203 [Fulvia fulva]WPV08395.1 hypothetical protein CLAFUW4_00203 [Fulvia fulva]WPV24174.1 hypothetical protein CLAFUW7_00206 [Fulvia fulva]